MADKIIKSVRRVFEILELFDKARRPLSAKEVADALGYPVASTHALMKSMHELGYAEFDSPKWTYLPSRKYSLLGEWLHEYLDRETQLLDCMDALNKETRETINLSRLVGPNVKIIHGLECIHTIGVSVKVGTLMSATESLTGITALATLEDDAFASYFEQLQKNSPKQAEAADEAMIRDVKRELKELGTVSRCDLFVQGIGAVCVPVESHHTGESLIIGVVGPSDRIFQLEADHRRTLKRIMAAFGIKTHYRIRNSRKSA